MKKFSLWLIPLVLCACTQDWSSGLESARLNRGGGEPRVENVPDMAASPARAQRRSTFASYPDTGSLVHYNAQVAPRQTGAYTWHAADLSEAHAFRAMASGEMTFESPDGTPIKLAYQRHIEHPDGNWSWVGAAADGQTAVITFGEDAAFGTIPQGNDLPPLRLTLSDGRAWVVSADKDLLGEIRNEATHPSAPDYLVPPKRVLETAAASSGGMTAAAAPAAQAAPSGKTVIDVLVGYTNGFAASPGSESAAMTRIRNLVDITNQAYVSSQINAELRLVHSMQVNFPDNTSNIDALEKLTGFRAPSTQISPDPAFSALRQARETYGADLVALVRKFNDPENGGCGVAWLLGGGMSGIRQSDEFFAYSVISDGSDRGSDNKTYFCREETFAHEIGHNLGSQHDIETSKGGSGNPKPGAYSYSYGYKTGSAQGNFYTIMAYGDSGQTGYQVFSNPDITSCGGWACGTVSANNAKSINQTAAIIAGFRATTISISKGKLGDDTNNDGRSDLIWHNKALGAAQVWQMSGPHWSYGPVKYLDSRYVLEGIGDFNNDGYADFVWTDDAKATVWAWIGQPGGGYSIVSLGAYPYEWNIVGVADVNGDGRSDVVWHNPTRGLLQSWLMDEGGYRYSRANAIASQYRVDVVDDFNGDGLADIIWHDLARTTSWAWLGQGDGGYSIHRLRDYPAGWSIVGTGDANGDGRADVFWHNPVKGYLQIWFMNGAGWTYSRVHEISPVYEVASIGDFNGDGFADIAWVDVNRTQVWTWQATSIDQYGIHFLRGYPTGWVLRD